MSEGLKHICFDLDDTLYEQIAPFRQALLTIQSVSNEQIRRIYKSFRIRSNELFFRHQNKEISFEAMQIGRIQLALKDHVILIMDEEALKFQAAYQRGQYEISLSDTLVEILDYLKSRDVRISLITNGPYEHQLKKIRSLGLGKWIEEKDMIISSAVGISKPDERIFHMVCESGLYVGDSYENDVIGAKKAGWDVIWLNKYGQQEADQKADFTARDERELQSLLHNFFDFDGSCMC